MTDTGESSSSGTIVALAATNTAADRGIAKEDLIELIRAVKFKNPDFSQRQVHTEIVTEIPIRFPQYAKDLSPQSLSLNDVKKAWKKAILQQAQPSNSGSNGNGNADLVERLKSLSTNPQLYTIGLDGGEVGSSSAAREYVAKFMEEEQLAHSAKERELLEDYVHVFLDVPADSSVAKKPHQALINFQSNSAKTKANPKGALFQFFWVYTEMNTRVGVKIERNKNRKIHEGNIGPSAFVTRKQESRRSTKYMERKMIHSSRSL